MIDKIFFSIISSAMANFLKDSNLVFLDVDIYKLMKYMRQEDLQYLYTNTEEEFLRRFDDFFKDEQIKNFIANFVQQEDKAKFIIEQADEIFNKQSSKHDDLLGWIYRCGFDKFDVLRLLTSIARAIIEAREIVIEI